MQIILTMFAAYCLGKALAHILVNITHEQNKRHKARHNEDVK